jgi:pyruvate dehydrogenase E1 component beta subunit
LVTVEDGYPTCGIGAEIVATIMESPAFDYLDSRVERVTAWDIALPYAKNLERATLP